jgi:hypothetical protein
MPNWYNLIHYWCREHKPKGYGLTIPFIIGAQENITISELLEEIVKSDKKVILQWCNDLQEYVLSLDDLTNPYAKYLHGEGGLKYYDEKIEELGSLDDVISFLEKKYSDCIKNKCFSKNKSTKTWQVFTANDLNVIKAAKANKKA